jgi:signal transduction histidine kinase
MALLAGLCLVLATLQYRWLGEISRAEQDRLRSGLQADLNRLSQEFDAGLAAECRALMPGPGQVDSMGQRAAYEFRYARWKQTTSRKSLFRRVGLAVPDGGQVVFYEMDPATNLLRVSGWPARWSRMRDYIQDRVARRGPPRGFGGDTVVEFPRMSRPGETGPGEIIEQDWLIVEFDLDYIAAQLLPPLIGQHLATPEGRYQAEIVRRSEPAEVIARAGLAANERIGGSADGSVGIFDPGRLRRRPREQFGRPPGPAVASRAVWTMNVRHPAGSLAVIVQRARYRNMAISAAVVLLMMGTMALVVRASRQARQLAEMQMNFVAGVSHELRTPLTVIRTGAFNLKRRAKDPAHVERYADLIQEESTKLTALVEQILRFAGAASGAPIREREPVAVENVIEDGLRSSRLAGSASYEIEKSIEPGLPLVLADEIALRHAVQNLLENAAKYGTEGSNWIGVSAVRVDRDSGPAVEIRVSDRGPGIPAEEQRRIFDPFFRGRRAVSDQIHGTGLGLNLVKKIVEAHGGQVEVKSEPMQGTEFTIRIPAAPPEMQDEFAHSLS